MGRLDRYFLTQFMSLFGFFGLVLVLIYWINRAVILFDQLIADGQSAAVFLEFTALSLPTIMRIVLPLAAFAAALYVTNRLASESELVVAQATGCSAMRLARPVLAFGLTVTLMTGLLTHLLVPVSRGVLEDREAEIARNVAARFLTEGRFANPVDGLTVYIREIEEDGTLHQVFLHDSRDSARQVSYTADRAYLIGTEAGPQLVMTDGLVQTLRTADQRLFTTRFDDFVYDVGRLVPSGDRDRRRLREIPSGSLIGAGPALREATRSTPLEIARELHERNAEALLGLVGALLGFSALMVGQFSRFGVWRQVLLAVALVVVVNAAQTAGGRIAGSDAAMWPALYLPIVTGLAMVAVLLLGAMRPGLFRPRTWSRDRGARRGDLPA